MAEKRILAVEIDNTLFDELDNYVRDNGLSKKRYVAEVLRADLAQKLKQQQEIKEPEINNTKGLGREAVAKAIDDFIIQNGRVPTQKEFKNENGLPSYGAASRALEFSAAQYANQRLIEISNKDFEEDVGEHMAIDM